MDKIFETMPVGKLLTRSETESLAELLKRTEIEMSSSPKKLTLSEIHESNIEEIVEEVANNINEKLNFQTFEQDFEVIEIFNTKVEKLKSEFAHMADYTSNTRPRSSKMLPFEHSDIDQLKMIRPNTDSFKRKELLYGSEENKENRQDILNLGEVNLGKNKVNRIPLECEEKLRLFRDCFKTDEKRETVNLSDLECSDEVLQPKRSGDIATTDEPLFRRQSDSSIVIDEDVVESSEYMG